MDRRQFFTIAGGTVLTAAGVSYLISDKNNFVRTDIKKSNSDNSLITPDEREILYLASLAPSGHNAQPWFVKYIEPYHWTICNDKSKWLPAVDPTQRETILSIGSFIQNLEYAAGKAGFNCEFNIVAKTNQDENIADVQLTRSNNATTFNTSKIKNRRTVRSNFLNEALKKDDADYLFNEEKDFFNFIHNSAKEYHFLNEQTIEEFNPIAMMLKKSCQNG